MNIDDLRKQIDNIDGKLSALLKKRMELSAAVADYKAKNDLPVLSVSREQAILDRVSSLVGDEVSPYIKEVYLAILDESRKYQKKLIDQIPSYEKNKSYEYGLIGEHLAHSYSPQIHAAFGDYDYSLIELAPDEVEGFLKARRFKAVNVTIPYKKVALALCDKLSDEAKAIGSVNTIVNKNGKLYGYNTDAFGFEYMLRSADISPYNKKCIVLGSGGASVTAVYVLKKLGASSVVVVSRSGDNNYQNLHLYYDAEIIVNTTPVGMYPDNGKSVIELSFFKNCTGVIDMIYNPARTKLILDAERLSIPAVSGLPMLVAQGKKAYELFFGTKADDSIIDKAIRKVSHDMMNITLIGMPGSGKSTIGILISKMTGRELVDTDELIEKTTGKSPSEIITSEGEAEFRKIESGILAEVSKQSGKVIACGGGIVTIPRNLDMIRQNSLVFFINRDLNDLDTGKRPLSANGALPGMYKMRLPLYRAACDHEIKFESSYQSAHDIIRIAGYGEKDL